MQTKSSSSATSTARGSASSFNPTRSKEATNDADAKESLTVSAHPRPLRVGLRGRERQRAVRRGWPAMLRLAGNLVLGRFGLLPKRYLPLVRDRGRPLLRVEP